MYDVQAFLRRHNDGQKLRNLITSLLEIWHEQNLSQRAADDESLTMKAQDIGFQLRMHGLTAEEIEAIWDNEDDFRVFLGAHPSPASKEPAA